MKTISISYGNKIYFCLFLVPIIILASCTPYSPPTVQHSYFTNTQSHHELTGLKILYEAGLETGADVIGQIGFATFVWTEYFIDGRKVAKHAPTQGLDTFVQLPPGRHQLVIQGASQGVLTLGAKSRDYKLVYDFVLDEGQRGTFSSNSVPGQYGSGYSTKGFEDVSSWRKIE